MGGDEHQGAAAACSSRPYRDISMPLIKYIKTHRHEHGSEVVTVYTPQYIVGHWWETFLHNHKARRIRHKLALVHGVVIALVPWLLDSSTLIYGRRSRPLPGQDRRGEPVRPVMRKPMPPAATTDPPPHPRPKSPATRRRSTPRPAERCVAGTASADWSAPACASASTRCSRTPRRDVPAVDAADQRRRLVRARAAGRAGLAHRARLAALRSRHRAARVVHDVLGAGRLGAHADASRPGARRSRCSTWSRAWCGGLGAAWLGLRLGHRRRRPGSTAGRMSAAGSWPPPSSRVRSAPSPATRSRSRRAPAARDELPRAVLIVNIAGSVDRGRRSSRIPTVPTCGTSLRRRLRRRPHHLQHLERRDHSAGARRHVAGGRRHVVLNLARGLIAPRCSRTARSRRGSWAASGSTSATCQRATRRRGRGRRCTASAAEQAGDRRTRRPPARGCRCPRWREVLRRSPCHPDAQPPRMG